MLMYEFQKDRSARGKKRMKALIFTNFSVTTNYGAILQSFALNRYINNIGVECKTVDLRSRNTGKSKYEKIKKSSSITGLLNIAYRTVNRKLISKVLTQRKEIFDEFRARYIPHTSTCYRDSVNDVTNGIDVAICGSDQIWRPSLDGRLDEVMWLTDVSVPFKASYAASIGVERFSSEQTYFAKNALKDFQVISVREKSAIELLQPLTEKKIYQVLDPVFLLDAEEWKSLSYRDNNQVKNYILVYYIHPDKKYYRKIEEIARENKKELVIIPFNSFWNIADSTSAGKKKNHVTPLEFVQLIYEADMIYTDSFHATAFSILFNKSFYYTALNYTTRVRSLLNTFTLEDRLIEKGNDIPNQPVENSRWDDVNKILRSWVLLSKEYINGIFIQ